MKLPSIFMPLLHGYGLFYLAKINLHPRLEPILWCFVNLRLF
jgi:hypothetical protein